MLSKLKQYALAIAAGAVALAYFFGIKRGKENEKAHQNNTLLTRADTRGEHHHGQGHQHHVARVAPARPQGNGAF